MLSALILRKVLLKTLMGKVVMFMVF